MDNRSESSRVLVGASGRLFLLLIVALLLGFSAPASAIEREEDRPVPLFDMGWSKPAENTSSSEQERNPWLQRFPFVDGLLPAFRFDLPGLFTPQWLYGPNPLESSRGESDPRRALGVNLNSLSSSPRSSRPDHPETAEGRTLAKDDTLKPSVVITAQLQSDFAWFDQSPNNVATVGDIPDGAFFRRARLGVFGELYKTMEYRLEFDFAGNGRPRFLDVWIAMTDLPIMRNIIVGHFFEPFSLERYTPNRFITFNERSLTDAFAPARNMGAMIYGNAFNKRLTWAVGTFRTNSDDYGDHMSEQGGWALTAHNTVLLWFEEPDDYTRYLFHLGGSYSYRSSDDDPVRFSSRPSIRLRQEGVNDVPVFVDTGNIEGAFGHQLVGVEAAWVHGPFSVQGEWIAAPVRRANAQDPFFHAGYVYASWFVTGESRSYSPTSILGRFREGIFQRVVPRTNVFDRRNGASSSGIGAWEIAARWAYIDLNSSGIEGGYMNEVTLGVNWYLNPYTRVSFNYVHPMLRSPTDGPSTASMYSLRFQFEF